MTEGGEDKSLEGLGLERRSSERAKISLPEGIFILLISLMAEIAEWIGIAANLIPAAGQVIFVLAYIFGLAVSAGINLWAFLRGLYERAAARKLLLIAGGAVLDLLSAGAFPETLTLAAAIWLHNHLEGKIIQRAVQAIEGKV